MIVDRSIERFFDDRARAAMLFRWTLTASR